MAALWQHIHGRLLDSTVSRCAVTAISHTHPPSWHSSADRDIVHSILRPRKNRPFLGTFKASKLNSTSRFKILVQIFDSNSRFKILVQIFDSNSRFKNSVQKLSSNSRFKFSIQNLDSKTQFKKSSINSIGLLL